VWLPLPAFLQGYYFTHANVLYFQLSSFPNYLVSPSSLNTCPKTVQNNYLLILNDYDARYKYLPILVCSFVQQQQQQKRRRRHPNRFNILPKNRYRIIPYFTIMGVPCVAAVDRRRRRQRRRYQRYALIGHRRRRGGRRPVRATHSKTNEILNVCRGNERRLRLRLRLRRQSVDPRAATYYRTLYILYTRARARAPNTVHADTD